LQKLALKAAADTALELVDFFLSSINSISKSDIHEVIEKIEQDLVEDKKEIDQLEKYLLLDNDDLKMYYRLIGRHRLLLSTQKRLEAQVM